MNNRSVENLASHTKNDRSIFRESSYIFTSNLVHNDQERRIPGVPPDATHGIQKELFLLYRLAIPFRYRSLSSLQKMSTPKSSLRFFCNRRQTEGFAVLPQRRSYTIWYKHLEQYINSNSLVRFLISPVKQR
jgi:hypothetical protein